MADTEQLARERLSIAEWELKTQEKGWDKRASYVAGDQDLPYAPEGVNAEYQSLQDMSIANWMEIAVKAPTQRLQVDGIKTGRDGKADNTVWNEIWQPNRLDSRQAIPYQEMYTHGRGIMAVSANPRNRKQPIIRPESSRRVWLGADDWDPFTHVWACKIINVRKRRPTSIALPTGVNYAETTRMAWVYDENEWFQYEASGSSSNWQLKNYGRHGLASLPFVGFDYNLDAEGKPRSAIQALIPQQDALNTIRFNTLLAMQFSAYRQRVFTGYDPVVRDRAGNPIIRMGPNNQPLLDVNGQPLPMLNSPGRLGVDRALVFPGADTKVFDLPESNLDNYIKVLSEFLTDFFAIGQIPPQYMLSRMANLSGDALAGAESTLQALVKDLKRSAGEALEQVMRLANRARGESHEDAASEVIWADTEPRSFAQVVDAIGKLIASGMSRKDAWLMLPGATPPGVTEWVNNSDAERAMEDAMINDLEQKLSYS